MLKNYKLNTIIVRGFVYFVLFVLLIVTIVPIWLLLVNATRSTVEIQQGISLFPSLHLFDNYGILQGRGLNLWRGFFNSLFVAVASTGLTVYFSLLTAYGIVVYDFKGKQLFSNFIILLVLIPMQLSIIGFYQYMSTLGLTDNFASLILPTIASAGAVFFGKQYLESAVIKDLIDAGRVDGAGELRLPFGSRSSRVRGRAEAGKDFADRSSTAPRSVASLPLRGKLSSLATKWAPRSWRCRRSAPIRPTPARTPSSATCRSGRATSRRPSPISSRP